MLNEINIQENIPTNTTHVILLCVVPIQGVDDNGSSQLPVHLTLNKFCVFVTCLKICSGVPSI